MFIILIIFLIALIAFSKSQKNPETRLPRAATIIIMTIAIPIVVYLVIITLIGLL